ncbi:MAG: GrdX family protein [Oscillospiraceae bacterium]
MGKCFIVTNNEKVFEKYKVYMDVEYLKDEGYLSVLTKARDLVHSGAHLLTHPLSGSLKPNQTPYKSILMTMDEGKAVALEPYKEVMLIENSMEAYFKFTKGRETPHWTEKIKNDFMTIDLSLITSAVKNPMLQI